MKTPTAFKSQDRGFALVVTVSLMVLLAVMCVGLLGLSAVSLRSSTQTLAQAEAQANARLALMIAIGELQRHTGSDTRVTASAAIVNKDHPPVLGVWKSWEGTNHQANGRPIAPDYGAKDQPESSGGRFLRWLVSSAGSMDNPGINDPPSLVSLVDGEGTVPLLADGSLFSKDSREVHVVPTRLEDGGRIAWWISGENQKARLAQPYRPRTNSVAGLAEMGQSHTVADPTVFGLPSLLGDPEPYNPNTAAAKPGRKALSRHTMALVEPGNPVEPHRKFHDLSTSAVGLLTNTATGGWRKDLSILTEQWDDIYARYPGGRLPLFRFSPASGDTSQVPKPTASNHDSDQCTLYPWSDYSVIIGERWPATLHAAAASWQTLVGFATAYRNFSRTRNGVESPFVWDAIAKTGWGGRKPTNEEFYNYKHKHRIYPQIARFQFLIYAQAREDPQRMGSTPTRYQLILKYVPIVTLWNPYNVRLTIDNPGAPTSGLVLGGRRGMPGALAVVPQSRYPNPDAVPGNEYRLVSNGNFQYLDVSGNFQNQYDTNLSENIKRFNPGGASANSWVDMRTWGANLPTGQISFDPGEAVMFSPDGRIEARFGGTGFGMEYGYRPEAVEGREINAGSNLTADQMYWFLLRTDKYTQPYKLRDPGVGFSLSYGIATGGSYTQGQLYSGVGDEYHNITSLSNGDLAEDYWPQSEVDEIGYSIAELASGPAIPLFSISLGPRITIGTGVGTEQNRPTKGLVQSDPLAAMTIADPADDGEENHPVNGNFDMSYHSLSLGSTITPNLSKSAGFIATGYQSGDGLSRLIMNEVPLRPMASLVELQGWNPRGQNPYPPFQMNLIGNSDATPLIPQNDIVPPALKPRGVEFNLQHDDAYCANHLLFDDWFVSSIAPQPRTFGGDLAKDITTLYEDFLRGEEQLANRAYQRVAADTGLSESGISELADDILDSPDGWLRVASRLEVDGMFNVNSTSVDAWQALLGQARSRDRIAIHGENGIVATDASDGLAVTRGAVATDVQAGAAPGNGAKFANASEYTGFRSLSDEQIEELAAKVVEQVRLRGPFLSLSEFVNRQLSNDKELALAGAIQSALNALTDDPMAVLRDPANSLSDVTMDESDPMLDGVNYQFSAAADGSSAHGVPGWIRQADILRSIAPVLSARDDTFTIRAYGDYKGGDGKVTARAWCEAVVKRTPEYSDISDAADTTGVPASETNRTFGRRYEIVSFRWLNSKEI